MFQTFGIRLLIPLLVSFSLLFNTPAALSRPCSNTSLALARPNDPQHPPPSLSTQEASLQARIPPALVHWRFGFMDPRLALFEPAVIVSVSVIVTCLIIIVRLLNRILDACLNLWAYSPPANQVVIEAGNMRLEFGCSMQPVPWEFIADFAASRRDATARGFAPGYAKEWWYDNKNQQRLCYAAISVVPDGGQAIPPRKPA